MKLIALAPILALAFSGLGCAHMVRIESAPGAEIYVNDQQVGTAPVTYQETTGTSDAVKVTAKLHGKEKTVMVPRDSVDMAPIGVGAGAGAGACLAGLGVTAVVSFIFLPCGLVTGALSWGALGAGPGIGWWFSHKMPDTVHVDLDTGPPAVADATREPDAEPERSHTRF